MKALNIIIMIISIISILFFIVMAFIRMQLMKKQAKKYGMKKQVTDPLLYWFSYTSGFVIIVIKIFTWIYFDNDLENNLWLSDIIPSLLLIIFSRTIGKTVIMRAEKHLYFNRLVAETKDIHKFVKEESKWMLYTATGKYPVTLSNTTVIKIADITGAKIEDDK